MKAQTVRKQVQKINNYFDRVESGKYVDLPISTVTDKIAWLWKYRYISEDEMTKLALRAVEIMDNYGEVIL